MNKFQSWVAAFAVVAMSLAVHAVDAVPAHAACGGAVAGLPSELVDLMGKGDAGVCTPPKAPAAKADPKPVPANAAAPAFKGVVAAVQGAHVPDEVLVVLRGDGAADRLAQLYALEIRSQEMSILLGGVLVRFGIPDGRSVALVRAALAAEPDVIEAVPNHIYELNGNAAQIERYSLAAAELTDAHELAMGRGVKIGIIDTAVDGAHPALAGAVVAQFDGLPDVPLKDTGHGTSIALLAGGAVAPFLGAAPAAALYIGRAFDRSETRSNENTFYAILRCLEWLMQQGVDVVNMSFSGPENKLMTRAIGNAVKDEVIIVAAAGNNGARAPFSYPAAAPGVVAVTATDAKNRIYNRANHGPYITLAAPGVDVVVPSGDEKVAFKSGTSYGAALVSGIAALLVERLGRVPEPQLREMLAKSVRDLGPPGRDSIYGHGLVRANSLLRLVVE